MYPLHVLGVEGEGGRERERERERERSVCVWVRVCDMRVCLYFDT